MENKLSTKPTRTMSFTLICWDEKMMALVGVAIGSIKAHDAATVIGKQRAKMSIFMDSAIFATMGTSMVTSAKLLINSVKKILETTSISRSK